MGKPSDKIRSARRLGKLERARVKKRHEIQRTYHFASVGGAGIYELKAGRKKMQRFDKFIYNLTNASIHQLVTHNSESLDEEQTATL